jgi:hypothetical protein
MAELRGSGCYIAIHAYADDSSVQENGKLSQRCYETIPFTRIKEGALYNQMSCNRLQLSTEALG